MAADPPGASKPIAQALARWIGWVVGARWGVLLMAVLLAGASLYYGARHLGVTTDTAELLADDLPFRQALQRLQQQFPQLVDTVIAVVEAPTPEQARAGAEALAERLTTHPRLTSVHYPAGDEFFVRHGLLFLALDELYDLSDRLIAAQPLLAQLLDDPTAAGLFGSLATALEQLDPGRGDELAPVIRGIDQGIAAVLAERPYQLSWRRVVRGETELIAVAREIVVIQPDLDFTELGARRAALGAIRDAAEELELGLDEEAGVRVRLTGKIALVHDELQSLAEGTRLTWLLALCAVAVVLYLAMRSVRLVAATLVTLLLGLALTAGFAALTVGRLNLISIAFALLYISLGVDYAIHFILRYRERSRRGEERGPALAGTGADLFGALGLCALSTAIAFYAFVPTPYAGVSELGIIAGTAMFISLALSFTVLPALLAMVPAASLRRPDLRLAPRAGEAVLRLPLRRPNAVRAMALVLGLTALLLVPQVRFDTDPLNLRDPDSESVAVLRDLLAAGESDYWDIAVLAADGRAAKDLERELAALDTVAGVRSLFDFVPQRQDEKLAVLDDLRVILGLDLAGAQARGEDHDLAETRAALEALIEAARERGTLSAAGDGAEGLLERLIERLRALDAVLSPALIERLENDLLATLGPALGELDTALAAGSVRLADLPETLLARWRSPAGVHRLQVEPAVDASDSEALGRFVASVQQAVPDATGAPVARFEAASAVATAFVQALALALAGVTVLLAVVLRRLGDTLAVVLPLLLGAAVTAAATVVIRMPFNFANIIALPLLLGIGVDSGIHMVQRARLGDLRDGHLLATSTARAVIYSTLTTAVGFGSLAFSPHPGTASMGVLLGMGVLVVLLTTLLVLPVLLPRRRRGG